MKPLIELSYFSVATLYYREVSMLLKRRHQFHNCPKLGTLMPFAKHQTWFIVTTKEDVAFPS